MTEKLPEMKEQLEKFVRWLYQEREVTFTLQNSNRDDLDERAAVALVDWFLMSPEEREREREHMRHLMAEYVEDMRKKGRYHG